jgi:hypothetical protein
MTGWPEPAERSPGDIIIFDRVARRWTVRLSRDGLWIGLVRGGSPGASGQGSGAKLAVAFDARYARNLSDALEWAARIADPRFPDPEPH